MSAGFGPVVNPVDGVGPPGQWRIIGVAGALVVDVPQQVGPAALLGAVIMVVGSVAIADQYAAEASLSASSTTALPRPRRRK